MDPVPKVFTAEDEEILSLVEQNPLAWVVADMASALLAPVRPYPDGDGNLVELRGHLPRSSSLVSAIRAGARVLILFQGTSAYISPSWFRNRNQAPTWASTSAAFLCDVTLMESAEDIEQVLHDLVEASELGRPKSWKVEELGERYQSLARHIVAFKATIEDSRAAFRVAQDEDDETFADVLHGLESEGQTSMPALMRSFRSKA